jgi:hypothetical protein
MHCGDEKRHQLFKNHKQKREANLAVNDHCGYQFVFRDRAFHQKWFPRSKNLLLFNLKKCKKIKKKLIILNFIINILIVIYFILNSLSI